MHDAAFGSIDAPPGGFNGTGGAAPDALAVPSATDRSIPPPPPPVTSADPLGGPSPLGVPAAVMAGAAGLAAGAGIGAAAASGDKTGSSATNPAAASSSTRPSGASGTGTTSDVVFAPHPGVSLASSRAPDDSTSTLPATPAAPGASATVSTPHLAKALDAAARSPRPFLDRYELYDSKHREFTDTAVVQRARGKTDGLEYAIKFFTSRAAYERERSMYADRDLRAALPPVTEIRSNEDAEVVADDGWVFPPFIITDRGESLDMWARNKRDPGFAATVRVLRDVAGQVKGLHSQGLVHRNLNPESILWRPKHQTWSLDDFGCADVAGMPSSTLTPALP